MERAVVQEERGEEAPILVPNDNRSRLQRAQPMQGNGVGRTAARHFHRKRGQVQKDERPDRGCPSCIASGRAGSLRHEPTQLQLAGWRKRGEPAFRREPTLDRTPQDGVLRFGSDFLQPRPASLFFPGGPLGYRQPELALLHRQQEQLIGH